MTDTQPLGPALYQYIRQLVQGNFEVKVNTFNVYADRVTVATGNMERLALMMINIGTLTVNFWLDTTVSTASGFAILPNGGIISFNARDDLLLPGMPWYAICSSGGTTVKTIEVVRYGS